MNTRVQHVVDTVKTAEVPLLQFTDKVVVIPVVALRQIPQFQHTDQVVDVLAVSVVQVPHVQVVVKAAEIPQLPLVVQVPHVQVAKRTVKTPQLLFVEKIAVIPEIRTVPGTQTFESVDAESVHQVIQAFVNGLITDYTNMGQSVFDGTNKLSHDIANGVHVGKVDLDDGMFELAEASKRQRHSSQHQSVKATTSQAGSTREREKGEERTEGRKSEEKVFRKRKKKETGEELGRKGGQVEEEDDKEVEGRT